MLALVLPLLLAAAPVPPSTHVGADHAAVLTALARDEAPAGRREVHVRLHKRSKGWSYVELLEPVWTPPLAGRKGLDGPGRIKLQGTGQTFRIRGELLPGPWRLWLGFDRHGDAWPELAQVQGRLLADPVPLPESWRVPELRGWMEDPSTADDPSLARKALQAELPRDADGSLPFWALGAWARAVVLEGGHRLVRSTLLAAEGWRLQVQVEAGTEPSDALLLSEALFAEGRADRLLEVLDRSEDLGTAPADLALPRALALRELDRPTEAWAAAQEALPIRDAGDALLCAELATAAAADPADCALVPQERGPPMAASIMSLTRRSELLERPVVRRVPAPTTTSWPCGVLWDPVTLRVIEQSIPRREVVLVDVELDSWGATVVLGALDPDHRWAKLAERWAAGIKLDFGDRTARLRIPVPIRHVPETERHTDQVGTVTYIETVPTGTCAVSAG